MFIYGTTTRNRTVDSGRFACPRCQCETDFHLVRNYEYFTVYFIPVLRTRLLKEKVQCTSCQGRYNLSILGLNGSQAALSVVTGRSDSPISQQIGDLVELTDIAAEEIKRRMAIADFDRSVVVRIALGSGDSSRVDIAFDYPLADGRDWFGQSKGVPIVIEKKATDRFRDRVIDYNDSDFRLR